MPNTKWTWSFVIVATIQACIILAFESYVLPPFSLRLIYVLILNCCRYVFARFQLELEPDATKANESKTIPTFLTLYIFGFVYELVLVYDALRMKNTIQVIGLCICNVGLLIYGAVQVDEIKEAVSNLSAQGYIDPTMWNEIKGFLIAIPCIIGFASVLMGFLAWKLYDEFAWTIYKHISADLRMKRRYLTYQVCKALLCQ